MKFSEIQKQQLSRKSAGKSRYIRLLVYIPVLLFVIGGAYVALRVQTSQSDKETTTQEEHIEVNVSTYYIPLTRFTNVKSSITLDELRQDGVAAFAGDVASVTELLDGAEIITIPDSDLYEWFRETNFRGVAIVPAERADPRLKTLRIGNTLLWDIHSNVDNSYPLVHMEVISVDTNALSELSTTNVQLSDVWTYVAGGEVIPARAVARKFRRTGDYTFPFHKVKSIFTEADVSSILLENAIVGAPDPCHGCVWFVGDEAFIEGLNYLGVDFVAFSGNHVGDGGIGGIARTREVLDEAKIAHTGASEKNQQESSLPAFVDLDGRTLGFLAYDDVAYYHWAWDGGGGVAKFSDRDANGVKTLLEDKIRQDVSAATNEADFVIVNVSWGAREYINWALDYQRNAAHAFIDAGADIVVGTHQHWVGEIEFYKGSPIFYGLGNFVFDQTHTDPTRQGAFVRLFYHGNQLVHIDIIPHQSCGPQQSIVDDESCPHFQPQLLEEGSEAYEIILERMFEYSDI